MGKSAAIFLGLRGFVFIAYLITILIMVLSYQESEHDFYQLIIRYNQWDLWYSIRYFAVISIIGGIYNSLIALCFYPGDPVSKTVVVIDVVMLLVVGSSLGVGWQTYLLMKNGSFKPVCDGVSDFCHNGGASLITCSIGFLLSFVQLMWTLSVTVDPLRLGS